MVREKKQGTSSLAVSSLVCGIIFLPFSLIPFIGFLFSAGVIVLGILGLKKRSVGSEEGRGLAIAGIVLGGLGMLLCLMTSLAVLIIGSFFTHALSTPLDQILIG